LTQYSQFCDAHWPITLSYYAS